MTEGVSSLAGVILSPEDVAWADSCLSKDPDSLDGGWNSLKDALLETFDSKYDHFYERENSPEEPKMEIFHSEIEGDIRDLVKIALNQASTSKGAAMDGDDRLNNENSSDDDFWSRHKMEDNLLPTYNNYLGDDVRLSDAVVDFVFRTFELDESSEGIFKVWDLDVPVEEGDLIKQLNKALAEKSLEDAKSSVFDDDSEAWEGMENDESVDDLISGIADLKLSTPNLGSA